ncbi:MAG TPA: hypothetical protein VFH51_07075, partial [Myxococcota bacterium]|nr:hypothetical protein [Myxococcota bacterium]
MLSQRRCATAVAKFRFPSTLELQFIGPVGSEARLHGALMPRLVSSVRALSEATTPRDVLLRVTQLDALADAAPHLTRAALDCPELAALLPSTVDTLLTFLDPLPAVLAAWQAAGRPYVHVAEGCCRGLARLAPCLPKAEVRRLVPVIAQAAATPNAQGLQNRALALLPPLLQRVAALHLPDEDLGDILHTSWHGISTPHLTQQAGQWGRYATTWGALHAWAQLLRPGDLRLALAATQMAVMHLAGAAEGNAPTELIESTLRTLTHPRSKLLTDTLELSLRRCIELARFG